MDGVLEFTFATVPQAFEQLTHDVIYLTLFGIRFSLLTPLAFKHETRFMFQALTWFWRWQAQ